jgi:hypothetical protein
MRTFATVIGLLSGLAAIPASATVLLDTTHAPATANSTRLVLPSTGSPGAVPRGGPVAMSFFVPTTMTISDVSLQLTANNPSDGGLVLVFLVADTGTGGPGVAVNPLFTGTGSSLAFTNAIQIGSIADSALPSVAAGSLFKFNTSISVGPGEYWLAAENTLGTGGVASTAKWVFDSTSYTAGTGTAGQSAFWQAGATGSPSAGAPGTFSDTLVSSNPLVPGTNNLYLAQVEAPEPLSIALLGVGVAGIGVVRRHRRSA